MRRFLPLISLAALVACAPEPLKVTDARIVLPAVPGRPGVAYFTIKGGVENETLIDVSSPSAVRAEIHESGNANGMMSMRRLDAGVPVPAQGKIRFEPGGKHVMLFDINPALKAGTPVRLELRFASRRTLLVDAPAEAAGTGGEHAH